MPMIPIKKEFVPLIKEGRKIHTVRVERKQPIKVGDLLFFYSDARTPQMQLQFTFTCTLVERIRIHIKEHTLEFFDTQREQWLTAPALVTSSFAWADGFDMDYEFFEFFRIYTPEEMNKLVVYYWDPSEEQRERPRKPISGRPPVDVRKFYNYSRQSR